MVRKPAVVRLAVVRTLGKARTARAHRRDAAVTLEAVLGIPLFLIAVMGTFLFGMIMTVSQGVTHAAIEAARDAARVNSTVAASNSVEDAAVTTASDVLTIYGLTASGAAPTVQVIVEDSTGSSYCGANIVPPAGGCGANVPPAYADCATTSIGVGDTRRVRVRVVVDFTSVPIPDFLGYFGVSISGKRFDSRSDALRDL